MVRVAREQFGNNVACITCLHVMQGDAIKLVSRDDEAEWQFLCGQSVHEPFEARIISLEEAIAMDDRLADLTPLKVGETRCI